MDLRRPQKGVIQYMRKTVLESQVSEKSFQIKITQSIFRQIQQITPLPFSSQYIRQNIC